MAPNWSCARTATAREATGLLTEDSSPSLRMASSTFSAAPSAATTARSSAEHTAIGGVIMIVARGHSAKRRRPRRRLAHCSPASGAASAGEGREGGPRGTRGGRRSWRPADVIPPPSTGFARARATKPPRGAPPLDHALGGAHRLLLHRHRAPVCDPPPPTATDKKTTMDPPTRNLAAYCRLIGLRDAALHGH